MNASNTYRERSEEPLNYILSLPIELIVYVLSFLTTRDVVKLRYVSKRLRDVSETPSLWREFIWPRLDVNEERCVKSVLKSYGQYVKRLSFPDHAPTSSKLTGLLRHCKDLKEVCFPTRKLSLDQLEKVMQSISMDKLQHLDIPWTSDIHPLLVICSRLKELTIRVEENSSRWNLDPFVSPLESWLDEWVVEGFLPQTIKLVVEQNCIPITALLKHWLRLNHCSPTGHSGCLEVFGSLKVPMDLLSPVPFLQLQFGQSCTLPLVKPNKCGLLGLEEWDILLTDSTYCGKVICTARMTQLRPDIDRSQFSTEITAITHFDASQCQLHSGHLEQLAIASPRLQYLSLQNNVKCLERLHGLCELLACKNLRGLNLLGISEVENCVQLWKILVDMRLFCLAIEESVLIPWVDDDQIHHDIITSFQKCSNLKALEVHNGYSYYSCNKRNLSALSHFPSLVYCLAGNSSHDGPVDLELVVNSCAKLKYLSCHSAYLKLSHSLTQNINLEQLYLNISPLTSLKDTVTFMQSISAHGGLVHVLCSRENLYDVGIEALIKNSPNLFTCHLITAHVRSQDTCRILNLKNFRITLKKQFCDRKLFTSGDFWLSTRSRDVRVHSNTYIASFWPKVYHW